MGGDGKENKLRMGGLCCTKTVQAARKKQSVHRNNKLSDSMPFKDFVFYLQAPFRTLEKKRAAGYLENMNSIQTAMNRGRDHTSFTLY